jgi:hypothetical protein
MSLQSYNTKDMQDLGGKATPRTNMRPAGAITLFVVVFSLLLAILLIAMWLW